VAFETISAGKTNGSVFAFYVVTIESVGRQTVLAGKDGYGSFERRGRLPLENIAAPDLHQRSVAKNPQVTRPATSEAILGGLFSYFNLDGKVAFRYDPFSRLCH